MSRSTLAALASLAMICTISSRGSPLPPGNWCDAFNVTAPAPPARANERPIVAAMIAIQDFIVSSLRPKSRFDFGPFLQTRATLTDMHAESTFLYTRMLLLNAEGCSTLGYGTE